MSLVRFGRCHVCRLVWSRDGRVTRFDTSRKRVLRDAWPREIHLNLNPQ